jgi:hypothetical protein
MSQPSEVIFLYSKYSSNSKKLLDVCRNKVPGIRYLCIDNINVRKRVLKNTQIKITYVPCILLIYTSGVIEKYEGEHAFMWIKEMVEKMNPPQQELPPPPNQQELQPVKNGLSGNTAIENLFDINDEEEEEEEEEEEVYSEAPKEISTPHSYTMHVSKDKNFNLTSNVDISKTIRSEGKSIMGTAEELQKEREDAMGEQKPT